MYKVIRKFRDKYTDEVYAIGDSFTSDDPERISDLLQRKLIEGVPDTPSTSYIADKNAYQLMTKKELMQLLNQKGIEFSDRQKKAELIELLGGD